MMVHNLTSARLKSFKHVNLQLYLKSLQSSDAFETKLCKQDQIRISSERRSKDNLPGKMITKTFSILT